MKRVVYIYAEHNLGKNEKFTFSQFSGENSKLCNKYGTVKDYGPHFEN